MKKITLIIIVIAIISYAILNLLQHPQTQALTDAKPIIKIGVTLPLTGDVAFAGQPAKKAIELSMRDVQKNPNLKYDYELIFEDDKLDSKNILLNYNRFKSLDKVNAVISMWGNALVISQKTDQDKIIHFGCSWGYSIGKGYYNFNHSTLPDEQIGALITEFNKRNIKKIGIISNTTKGDQELISLFIPKLKEAGIDVVFENMFQTTQKDFRTDIVKMKEKEVDIVFISMVSPGMEIFVKQANELAFTPQYTTLDYFAYNPDLFEGQWYVTDALGNKEFQEYFSKETNEKPNSSCVANLYDIVKILVRGFENAPAEEGMAPTNDAVVETILHNKKFDTATTGAFIDDEGNIHTKPTISIIKDGKPELLEE